MHGGDDDAGPIPQAADHQVTEPLRRRQERKPPAERRRKGPASRPERSTTTPADQNFSARAWSTANTTPRIPAKFDDLGLRPFDFRVLARIWRRAGSQGRCWEGATAMATGCRVSRASVYEALELLLDLRLVRQIAPGVNRNKTAVYGTVLPEEWPTADDVTAAYARRASRDRATRRESNGSLGQPSVHSADTGDRTDRPSVRQVDARVSVLETDTSVRQAEVPASTDASFSVCQVDQKVIPLEGTPNGKVFPEGKIDARPRAAARDRAQAAPDGAASVSHDMADRGCPSSEGALAIPVQLAPIFAAFREGFPGVDCDSPAARASALNVIRKREAEGRCVPDLVGVVQAAARHPEELKGIRERGPWNRLRDIFAYPEKVDLLAKLHRDDRADDEAAERRRLRDVYRSGAAQCREAFDRSALAAPTRKS